MLDKFLEDYNSAVSICMVDEEEGFEEIKKVVDGFNNNNIIIPKDKFIYKEPLKESDAFIKVIQVKENCFITMSMRKHSKNGNGIDYELHYIHVSDENWKKQIEERNKRVEEGSGGSDFYLDEGLMKKLASKFEEPTEDEVDVWYENDYMNRKLK